MKKKNNYHNSDVSQGNEIEGRENKSLYMMLILLARGELF